MADPSCDGLQLASPMKETSGRRRILRCCSAPIRAHYEIEHTHIHGLLIFAAELGGIEESKDIQAMVQRNDHHVSSPGQVFAV